jgi:hypothetical protein
MHSGTEEGCTWPEVGTRASGQPLSFFQEPPWKPGRDHAESTEWAMMADSVAANAVFRGDSGLYSRQWMNNVSIGNQYAAGDDLL